MGRDRQIDKITVLGSSGQIGKPLARFLRNKGHDVIECDIENSKLQDLRQNPLFLHDYFNGTDFVFFLSFDIGGSRYIKENEHSFSFIDDNTRIMQNTFGLSKKYELPFIFASSAMSLLPFSPYGNLKLLGEKYTNSLHGVSARLWNVYGWERHPERYHVISDLIAKGLLRSDLIASEGLMRDPVQLGTTGEEKRQFLYVDDCCEALYGLYEDYCTAPPIVDIASGKWVSILEVARTIKEVFEEVGISFEFCPGKNQDVVQNAVLIEPSLLKDWNSMHFQ
jgi:nucleoside-diphosphate-sugar epimerase